MPRGAPGHGIVAACALLAFACAWQGPPRADVEPGPAKPVVVLAATGQVSPAKAQDAIDAAVATTASRERAEQLVTAIQAQTGVPLIRGNHARLLIDGPQTYQAILAAVKKPVTTFTSRPTYSQSDEVGQRFADALTRKQREGVASGSSTTLVGTRHEQPGIFRRMAAHGIEVAEFHPLKPSSLTSSTTGIIAS